MMILPARSRSDGFWAITAYFNPLRYRRRLSNFRVFRSHLNLPLLAVELRYGPDYELMEQDADIIVRTNAGALLWQKERLLNLALAALPDDCRKVAWLDCDIVFEAVDWAEHADRLLDSFSIIQLFKNVHYLSAKGTPGENYTREIEFTRPSAAFSIASGEPAATSIGHPLDSREGTSANGFAWAARRGLLEQHGFYDAGILGGGDRAMNCAANRCFDELIKRHYMNQRQQDRYLAWAEPFYKSVRGKIGYLDNDILHLWHGKVDDRGTRSRHQGLQKYQFDPFVDIAKNPSGCWRWNTPKREMHDYISGYFSSRREDG